MRKSLAIVLSALLLMTACCFALPVSAAEGTPINTAEEFAAMAADGTYYLNADITLSASYANPFTGTLDGNGKTVTVSAPMFAEFNGTLKNITITGNISSTADTGAVAPLSNSGCVMNNVTNNVNISVITDTAVLVGGLIGNDLGTDIVSDYTGVTNNLQRRLQEHIQESIPGFTQKYHANLLVYFEKTNNIQKAIHREKEIKGWTRAKKNALVESINPEWKNLGDDILLPHALP